MGVSLSSSPGVGLSLEKIAVETKVTGSSADNIHVSGLLIGNECYVVVMWVDAFPAVHL